MIPHKNQALIGDLLTELMRTYHNYCPEVSMNSLEDAYLHIYNRGVIESQIE